ncbi:acyl-CoA thioesterase [Williamsia sp. MIQD14]|uniref:acyl-CoA thioesterase n=1 Tax=Williamsia sp. MIQD14 TaxID=3425703 RepID=UPI003DA1B8CE
MTTRWADNDMYGHLNNAVYYQLFDTAINAWIIESTGTDPIASAAQGVVVESGCRYFESVQFPEPVTVAIAVARLGSSSVTYDLGLVAGPTDGASPTIAARGRWVHVYVDTTTRRPVPIPDDIRELLATADISGRTTTPDNSDARGRDDR